MKNKLMKAAVLEGIGKFSVREVPIPELHAEDVLLKIDACGICGSDLRIINYGNKRINYPQIFGHEITGTIVDVGSGHNESMVGSQLSLGADIPCGKCEWCLKGLQNHCDEIIAFGYEYAGGFSEYLKLDKRILTHGPRVFLPRNTALEKVALAEPLACCINGLEICNLSQGDDVLIYGAGPIGSILTRLARYNGAKSIVLCDVDTDRLEASKISGADRYVSFSDDELTKANTEMTEGKGFNVVITACPSLDAQESAIKYVRKKGVINFFGGLPQNSKSLNLDTNLLHYKEISLLGSHGSTPKHHEMAVELLFNRKVILEDLISKTFKLDDIGLAVSESINNKNNLKIIIKP